MSGGSGARASSAQEDESETIKARCTLQKRVSALLVQEEEQDHLQGQLAVTAASEPEADTRRSAFVDEILQVI